MGVYEIFFKSNGKEVVTTTSHISKNLKDINKQTKQSSDVCNVLNTDFSKTLKTSERVSKKGIGGMSKEMKDLVAESPFGGLQKQMDSMNKKSSLFKKAFHMDIGPLKAATNQFGALRKSGVGTMGSLSGAFKIFGQVGGIAFKQLTMGALGLMTALWPLLAIFVAIKVAMFIFKKMWQINFLGMQTTFNKVFGKIRTAWAKFNISIIRGLRKMEPAFKTIGKIMKMVFMPQIIALKVLFWLFGVIGRAVWGFVKHFSGIAILFKAIKMSIGPVKSLFEWFKGTKVFDGTMKALQFINDIWAKIKQAMSNFISTLPGWAKKLLGIDEIELKGSPGSKGNSGATNNNSIINDNKNVTIMSNKQVDKAGANGLSSIIQAQAYTGGA